MNTTTDVSTDCPLQERAEREVREKEEAARRAEEEREECRRIIEEKRDELRVRRGGGLEVPGLRRVKGREERERGRLLFSFLRNDIFYDSLFIG